MNLYIINTNIIVLMIYKRSVVVKGELSQREKLSIYRSVHSPTFTYGPELCVVTERMKIQVVEMSFLRRMTGLSFRDRMRSLDICEKLRVELLLLHMERSQLRWFGYLFRIPPGRLPEEGDALAAANG